jgi:hypothetical protein
VHLHYLCIFLIVTFSLIGAVPGNQMKRYYIFGDVDPCTAQLEALKLAFRLQLHRQAEAEVTSALTQY